VVIHACHGWHVAAGMQDEVVRQYLTVPASSASPERLFSSVGIVKSDFRGRLLDTTLIDVMWAK
jgi:hypothetical protein